MKKLILKFTLLFLSACSNQQTTEYQVIPSTEEHPDYKVARSIMQEIGGEGEFFHTENQLLPETDPKRHYIQLIINSSYWTDSVMFSKALVASYCAAQLYRGISDSSKLKNYGIEIVFPSDILTELEKPYLYNMSELDNVVNAIDITEECISQGTTVDKLDTVELGLTSSELSDKLTKLDSLRSLYPTSDRIYFFGMFEDEGQPTIEVFCLFLDYEMKGQVHFFYTIDKKSVRLINVKF